ncbi:MAG: hypothetical protein MUF60_06940 [Vicinamibacterales bacterium]|nr:hypothetical protein [Vicinamibacterales bacterium]
MSRERLVTVRPDEVLGRRQAPPDTHIVVPVEEMAKLDRLIRLSSQPSVLAGHHRIFEATAFTAAVRSVTGG